MDQFEKVSQKSTSESAVYKFDDILRQYSAESIDNEGKDESSAFCKECIQVIDFNIKPASHVCFSCNVYLCAVCAWNNHPKKHPEDPHDVRDSKQAAIDRFMDIFKEINQESDSVLTQNFDKVSTSIHSRIDIRHKSDWKQGCWVKDMCVLDNGFLAITDSESNTIKLFDKNHEIIRRFELWTWPCGIVQIPKKWDIYPELENFPENMKTSPSTASISSAASLASATAAASLRVAITLPVEKKIVIVDLDNESKGHQVEKVLKVDSEGEEDSEEGMCYWLLFHEGLFITLCHTEPPTCLFITLSGIKLKTLWLDFVNDWYPRLNIHPETETLYLGSYDDFMVFSMDMCGNLLHQTDKEIFNKESKFVPYGVTIDKEQNVYVCSEENDTIYKFSADLKHHEVLVDKSICRIDKPAVLVHSKGRFYVSHDHEDLPKTVTVLNTE